MENKGLLKQLKKNLIHANNSQLYKEKFKNLNLDLSSISDFKKIPFTTKDELRKYYPFGNLAVEIKEVIEMHTSSGTTGGDPQVTFLTKKDLEIASKSISHAWKTFGITSKSVVQFIMSYGLFSGAMLNTFAIQNLGALVIPAGIIPTKQQVYLIQKFNVDTIVATPSYYLYLYEFLKNNLIPISSLNLKRGIAAGEIYSEGLRKEIEKKFNITIYDHYGLCEVYTGIAYECNKRNGLHVLGGYVFAEIIDPDTGEDVKEGEIGELILTTLKKDASPLIRYKTGDMVKKIPAVCSCGDNNPLISRILKRKDATIFIKGIKLDPYEAKINLNNVLKEKFYDDMQFVIPKNLSLDYPKIYLAPKKKNIDLSEVRKIIKSETNLNFEIKIVHIDYFRKSGETKIKLVKYI